MPTKTPRKRRVKIQRPPNAAPNTAFTQVSQANPIPGRIKHKIRVAMDPSDLADDSFSDRSKFSVRGVVLYTYLYEDENCLHELEVGCRTPDSIKMPVDEYYFQRCHRGFSETSFLDLGTIEAAIKEFKE